MRSLLLRLSLDQGDHRLPNGELGLVAQSLQVDLCLLHLELRPQVVGLRGAVFDGNRQAEPHRIFREFASSHLRQRSGRSRRDHRTHRQADCIAGCSGGNNAVALQARSRILAKDVPGGEEVSSRVLAGYLFVL